MKPENRQTILGVFVLTVVVLVAMSEGMNGRVLMSYIAAIVALIAPQVAKEGLPWYKR